MNESIFDHLIGQRFSERLDSIILQDDVYKQLQEVLDQKYMKMDAYGFSSSEKDLIDNVITAYNALYAHYIKLAYLQGYKDCAAFLKEIGLVEINNMESTEQNA